MKVGIIVQARTSSSRLPRKVLKQLPLGSGITVLQQVIRRLNQSKQKNDLIVATSKEESDEEIVHIAQKEDVKSYRGDLNDVLGRYYGAARENDLDIIVRITADCPCIDPDIVDLVIIKHMDEKSDYTSNVIQRTFPVGLDVEVFNFNVLERIHKISYHSYEREHVTSYIHQHAECFKITHVKASKEYYAPHLKLTLDTEEDYNLLCKIFDRLYDHKDPCFRTSKIIKLFHQRENKDFIYMKVQQKSM